MSTTPPTLHTPLAKQHNTGLDHEVELELCVHESEGIFLKGHFGGSFFGSFFWVLFGGHFFGSFWGSFWGVRCYFAKVLSRNLIVFARNRCEAPGGVTVPGTFHHMLDVVLYGVLSKC